VYRFIQLEKAGYVFQAPGLRELSKQIVVSLVAFCVFINIVNNRDDCCGFHNEHSCKTKVVYEKLGEYVFSAPPNASEATVVEASK